VKVDSPKRCCLVEKIKTVSGKYLGDGARILRLMRKIEARHHACVLIQARSFGQSTQRTFDGAHSRIKLQIGKTLFVNSRQEEEAAVAAALQGEDIGADKACNRNDAARGPGLRVPGGMFHLLSVCAGHSMTSG